MKIEIPSIREQQKVIFEKSTQAAIEQLRANLAAPVLPGVSEINEADYSRDHLLDKDAGWVAPDPDLVAAYFRHFQAAFPEYGSDGKLAALLGVSSDRRIREFKSGAKKVPYEIWRRFLVMTGRAHQDVIKVFGFMG